MKTLEQYFAENIEKHIIDHKLRTTATSDGLTFYIHPDGYDGDTLDFLVKGNNLTPYQNGVQANNLSLDSLYDNIEFLSEQVHNAWWEEKKRQGFHAPMDCIKRPGYDPQDIGRMILIKLSRYCDKCHTDMYPYTELSEDVKEYDRVTVRSVLDAIKKMENKA